MYVCVCMYVCMYVYVLYVIIVIYTCIYLPTGIVPFSDRSRSVALFEIDGYGEIGQHRRSWGK